MLNSLRLTVFFVAGALILTSCSKQSKESSSMDSDTTATDATPAKGTFAYDVAFLKQYHANLVELHSEDLKSRLAILPDYQGRVMTSTASGTTGTSFGWINYDLISSKKPVAHIHAFGGEERFWLGPEGGQFSIYFKKGIPFTYDNWQVPKEIDTEPFTLVSSTSSEARFERDMHFENYSGTSLDLKVNRNIRLLSKVEIDSLLGINITAGLEAVGFESENILTNTGKQAWTKKTGLLSVWILSMMNASEQTTVAIPYKTGDEKKLGKIVTDDYFGKVPTERLTVKDDLILFKTDAKYRSKIGLSPKRAKPIITSYDGVNHVLTIATFTLSPKDEYVNGKWEIQNRPFSGDAINSYNDGPVNGAQMGNVYEIESSSPGAALSPNKQLKHYHRTIHLKGSIEELNVIAIRLLGVTVDQIKL
ncbi:MAG: DUF6786 family protein [Chryseolinea sp.]